MSVRWWVAGGGVILLAIWGAATLGDQGRKVALARRSLQANWKPAGPPVPVAITLTGIIQATKVIKVAAPVEGTIQQFIADIGDDVVKGDVLARIEKSPGLRTNRTRRT